MNEIQSNKLIAVIAVPAESDEQRKASGQLTARWLPIGEFDALQDALTACREYIASGKPCDCYTVIHEAHNPDYYAKIKARMNMEGAA